MCLVHEQPIHAKLLKGHNAVLPGGGVELLQAHSQGFFHPLQLLDGVPLRTAGLQFCNAVLDLRNLLLNPLKIPASVRLFRYQEHTGKMIVDEDSCPKKLQSRARNTIRELNLNAPRLQRMRLALIRILEDEINNALAGGSDLEEFLPLLAESILLPDEDGNYQPFFSVARWYLGEVAEDILREREYRL